MKMMTAMYTIKRGGSYDRFLMMLDAFLEKGWEVHCLSLTPIQVQNPCFHNHILFYPFRNKQTSIAKLSVFLFFPLWFIWTGWRNRIDLVVAFGSIYAFLMGFCKWLLQKPMVTLIRGDYSFGLRTQNSSSALLLLNKMMQYYGLLFSDKTITNNSSTRVEILKSLGKRKDAHVQVLYNNIPPVAIREKQDIPHARDKYGIPKNAKVLVTAGVLNQGKNIEAIIKCLPKIEGKNVYCLIVGDGSTEADFYYRDSLNGLAKQLGVAGRVIFTGWVEKEKLWEIYLASDLFVLPSLNEGMPNAMLEALGSGLPCIGSNIPGNRDILQYEELMFDPLDEKAITEKIERTFSHSEFFNKIKELSKERKEMFIFDWKERAFETITGASSSSGIDG